MRITIKEVAQLAGVSPSTVSRVIANNPRISDDTRRRVFQIMEELNYYPNVNARNLVVKNTETIGLIMPRALENTFLNPFFPEVIRSISVAVQQEGYSILMGTARSEEEEMRSIIKMVQGNQVDGIILLHSKNKDPLITYLKERHFPFVLVGRPSEKGVTYVDNDNVNAAKMATQYLIEKGHRLISFLGGEPEYMVTRDRLQGYKEALQEADLPFQPELVLQADFLEEGGYQAVKQMVSLGKRSSALLVTDDVMAFGVISALGEMGYMVPEDMSIVSFNNVPLSRLSSPPLTTVDIGTYQLGYQAAQKLFERIRHPEISFSRTIITTKLIERQSVKRLS